MAQVADFTFGIYRLTWARKATGQHEATVKWTDETGTTRVGLKVYGKENKEEAIPALIAWVTAREGKALRTKGTKVADVWSSYYAECEKEGKQMPNFATNWKRLAPFFGAMDIKSITKEACQKYAVEKEAAGYAPWSIYGDLNRLRTLVSWAVKNKVITEKEAPYVWKPQEPTNAVDQAMTLAQVVELLDATPTDHMRLFIILAISTGGRLTALLELTWDRVDFAANEIDLRTPEKKKSILSKAFQKGRAVVAMNETIRAALLQAWQTRAGDESHVIQWRGTPVRSVKTAFNRAVERAGLPDWVTPHVLRHSTATIMDQQGVPVEEIAKFLGHSGPEITRKIYIERSGKSLHTAAAHVNLTPTKLRVVGK